MTPTQNFTLDDQLRRRYDAAAPGWQARIRRLRYDRSYTKTLKRLDYLGLAPSAHVLDAGVGSGALSAALTGGVRPVDVTGVDTAPAMLAEAGRTLAAAGAGYTPRRADVRALPFPDNTFDAVVSAHLLEHFASPLAALSELHRVLRPGAPLFVMVTRRGLGGHLVRLLWPVHPATPRGLAQALRQAGFRDAHGVTVQGPPWCRLLSLAALGRKG